MEQNIPDEGAVQQAMMIDEVQLHPPNQHNNNIQIGMALIRMEELNPVWNRAKDVEATRLWAKYFSGINQALQVQIPSSWANFFKVQLLSSSNFQFIKNHIHKQILQNDSGSILFDIPSTCPKNDFSCLTAENHPLQEED